jgi:hypothetical protein
MLQAANIIISEEKGTFSFIFTSSKASRTERFLSLVGQIKSQHSCEKGQFQKRCTKVSS